MAKKKTEKKELVKMEVRTINNGYALTVEGEEYLF